MNIFNIQSLISKGRVAKLSDIDPEKAYVQVGVYQNGNRPIGSGNANTYKECAVPLSELGQGGGTTSGVVILKKTVSLSDSGNQLLAFPSEGLYIVDPNDAYTPIVTNASTDLSGYSNMFLDFYSPQYKVFTTKINPPANTDWLKQLYVPTNFVTMIGANEPSCYTPPCNGYYVYDGATAGPMYLNVQNPTAGVETVDVYVRIIRIA